MPRTWAEWKCEASILDNQWRRFNATHPQTCYNCNKPGHIAQNCLEPCAHQVRNIDPLSPETIQAIVEAVRIAVGGDATRGGEVTGDTEPMRSKAKESQNF